MRSQLPDDALLKLLKQCYQSRRCQTSLRLPQARTVRNARTFNSSTARHSRLKIPQSQNSPQEISTLKSDVYEDGFAFAKPTHSAPGSPNADGRNPSPNIAILGGGITGLSSAYYLSQQMPAANITLYESTERLGGWLHSKHVDVGNGTVVFEQGPRTLRPHTPAGLVTLELVKKLGLEDEMIITPNSSVAARNRFIYYPDHLVRLPGPDQTLFQFLWGVFTGSLFAGGIPGIIREYRTLGRPEDLQDESIGSFLERRLGSTKIGDNLVSAVMHGIYAGDIYQLSAKSLWPSPWFTELEYGGMIRGGLKHASDKTYAITERDYALSQEMRNVVLELARSDEMRSANIYSFKRGIGTLSDALATALKKNSRVQIKTGSTVKKISLDSERNFVKISTQRNEKTEKAEKFDKVISTISGRSLSYLTEKPDDLLSLRKTHAVTVMVVNLYYDNPSIIPVHGFGYLIPRSIPWSQNPERALGVIFDSDASTGQDTAPGTKITVMLGGHWWDDFDAYPDEAEGAEMAKAILKRHLNIGEEPSVVNVSLQKDCIPQYTVGHDARMKSAHRELLQAFNGKLIVAGNSYTGVGLNDCVRAARDAVMGIKDRTEDFTGLDHFLSEKWLVKPVEKLVVKMPSPK